MRDFATHIHPVGLIFAAAALTTNAPIVSRIVDIAGYEGCAFLIAIGDVADADATFAVTIEHGDQPNLSDAAPVDAQHLTGTLALAGFTAADDNEQRKIGYVGSKQYVRLTITPSNNSAAAYLSAIALLGFPRHWPTPNPPG